MPSQYAGHVLPLFSEINGFGGIGIQDGGEDNACDHRSYHVGSAQRWAAQLEFVCAAGANGVVVDAPGVLGLAACARITFRK